DVVEVALVGLGLRVLALPRLVAVPTRELRQRVHLVHRLRVVLPAALLGVDVEDSRCDGGNPHCRTCSLVFWMMTSCPSATRPRIVVRCPSSPKFVIRNPSGLVEIIDVISLSSRKL